MHNVDLYNDVREPFTFLFFLAVCWAFELNFTGESAPVAPRASPPTDNCGVMFVNCGQLQDGPHKLWGKFHSEIDPLVDLVAFLQVFEGTFSDFLPTDLWGEKSALPPKCG